MSLMSLIRNATSFPWSLSFSFCGVERVGKRLWERRSRNAAFVTAPNFGSPLEGGAVVAKFACQ